MIKNFSRVNFDTGNGSVVIVSYSRRGLNQTGTGHFSPIGGYHEGKDLVLIMDVARFKVSLIFYVVLTITVPSSLGSSYNTIRGDAAN